MCLRGEKVSLICIWALFQSRYRPQPLLTLFNERKAIPSQASTWTQRWVPTLSAYEYELSCKLATEYANADSLSRLPLNVAPPMTPQLTC